MWLACLLAVSAVQSVCFVALQCVTCSCKQEGGLHQCRAQCHVVALVEVAMHVMPWHWLVINGGGSKLVGVACHAAVLVGVAPAMGGEWHHWHVHAVALVPSLQHCIGISGIGAIIATLHWHQWRSASICTHIMQQHCWWQSKGVLHVILHDGWVVQGASWVGAVLHGREQWLLHQGSSYQDWGIN